MKSLLFLCLLMLTTVVWAGECPQPYRNVATAAQSVANGSAPAGYAAAKPHTNMPKNGAITAKQAVITLLVVGTLATIIGAGMMILLFYELAGIASILLFAGMFLSGIALIIGLVSLRNKKTNPFPEYLIGVSAVMALVQLLFIPISMLLGFMYAIIRL